MLTQKMVENQLKYSGYDLDWLNERFKTEEDRTDWETICSFLPSNSIVYSICFGKYFGIDACFIAANDAIYMLRTNLETNKIVLEQIEYVHLQSVVIEHTTEGKIILLAAVSDETRVAVELDNVLVATHMRSTIIREIDSRSTIPYDRKDNYHEQLEQKLDRHHDEMSEIENELELEPQGGEYYHRSFEDNFKKIKTIYHIRRILVAMLVLWFPIFGFITYLFVWRIQLYTMSATSTYEVLLVSPTIADLFTIIFSSGILACVVFFYVYQKYLRNTIVNMLCYILMTTLPIIIIASCVPLVEIVLLAGEKTLNNSSVEFERFKKLPLLIRVSGFISSITSFISGIGAFCPLIVLNIGIYQNNKVK